MAPVPVAVVGWATTIKSIVEDIVRLAILWLVDALSLAGALHRAILEDWFSLDLE